jgi:undecaprenyl-diphosphatase
VTVFQALILGILQGLTEFLPISSSGHLVIAENFLHLDISEYDLLGFNIFLHVGSLLALLFCYIKIWWRIFKKDWHVLFILAIATIPAGIVGFLFEEIIASQFKSTFAVALMFLVTGVSLFLAEHIYMNKRQPIVDGKKHLCANINFIKSFAIGCAQACAIVPGLSRSGLTISMGHILGYSRRDAVDFSFLLAVPVIGGASVLALFHLWTGSMTLPQLPVSAAGFLSSFAVSVFAIHFLRRWVSMYSLTVFSWYLFFIAGILLLTFL